MKRQELRATMGRKGMNQAKDQVIEDKEIILRRLQAEAWTQKDVKNEE
jgi:hypothetical protein